MYANIPWIGFYGRKVFQVPREKSTEEDECAIDTAQEAELLAYLATLGAIPFCKVGSLRFADTILENRGAIFCVGELKLFNAPIMQREMTVPFFGFGSGKDVLTMPRMPCARPTPGRLPSLDTIFTTDWCLEAKGMHSNINILSRTIQDLGFIMERLLDSKALDAFPSVDMSLVAKHHTGRNDTGLRVGL